MSYCFYVHYYLFGLFECCECGCYVFSGGADLPWYMLHLYLGLYFWVASLHFWVVGSLVMSCKGLSAIVCVLISSTFGLFIVLVLPVLGVPLNWWYLCQVSELSDLIYVWHGDMFFVVSSIISPLSVSNSELDWAEIELIASGVLWCMGLEDCHR